MFIIHSVCVYEAKTYRERNFLSDLNICSFQNYHQPFPKCHISDFLSYTILIDFINFNIYFPAYRVLFANPLW